MASSGPVILTGSQINTHGPRASSITISVISGDSELLGAIESGQVQSSEWYLLIGSYDSMTNSSCTVTPCFKDTQITYSQDGIMFNTVRPYINNVYFRRGFEYLVNYATLESVVLENGEGGVATPFMAPCSIYTGYCFSTASTSKVQYTFPYSLVDAADMFVKAGLVAINSPTSGSPEGTAVYCSKTLYPSDSACTYSTSGKGLNNIFSSSTAVSTLVWYRHQNPSAPGVTNTFGSDCSAAISTWTSTVESNCQFAPNFYYRTDDPLRSELELTIGDAAGQIGFTFTTAPNGVNDAGANEYVLGATAAAFNPATGSWNASDVNGTNPNTVPDNWDFYTNGNTFSPIIGASMFYWGDPTYAFVAGVDTMAYNNATFNTLATAAFAPPSLGAYKTDTIKIMEVLQQELPNLNGFYDTWTFGINAAGWAGFANTPGYGDGLLAGTFYNDLNVYSTANGRGYGGNLEYALHQGAPYGITPFAPAEWIYALDIWENLYDTPLGTSPTGETSVTGVTTALINWMTTSYSATKFTGSTPSGPGASDFDIGVGCTNQTAMTGCTGPASTSIAIKGGEKITLNFRDNMTFSDNTPITASDYNFSLFAWDVGYTPWLPSLATPFEGELYPQLVSDYVNTATNTITIYLSTYSILWLTDVNLPMLSSQEFSALNVQNIANDEGSAYIWLPAAAANASSSWGSIFSGTPPEWLTHLPNLEVASSDYYLETYNFATGEAVLGANPNYQRTDWQVNASDNTFAPGVSTISLGTDGSGVILSPIQELMYNPGSSTFLGVGAGSTGEVGIPGSNITLASGPHTADGITIYKWNGHHGYTPVKGIQVSVTCNTSGQCSGSLSGSALSKLGAGTYEIVFQANYTFLGLARTWYQFTGFTIS